MNVAVFDIVKNLDSVKSFLHTRRESHGHNYLNTERWFKWKFLDSPNGSAIMPTVFVGDQIRGANYYGIYPLIKSDKKVSAIMPYEAFVHKSCQGKGMFKKLINLAENTAVKNDIQIMLAFPNKNSIKGFISSGWKYIPNAVTYWLKPSWNFNFFINILDLKKSFVANKPSSKYNFQFDVPSNNLYDDQIHGLWSKEYLEWRFNTLPQAEYVHLKQHSFEIVCRIGFRGKLKEVQILYIDFKGVKFDKKEFNQLMKDLKKRTQSDLISLPISDHHPIFKEMGSNGFYKFPSGTQFTYKLLDESLKSEGLNFSLCGLDFHTY